MRSSRLLAPFLLALALRCACAVLTEFMPLFPPQSRLDAADYDRQAWELVRLWSGEPRAEPLGLTPGRELYTTGLAVLYRVAGHHPLAAKLFNAALGSASVAAWQLTAAAVVGPEAAALTAVLLALWPSHVYYCSQNLKEALHLLILACSFLFLAPLSAVGPSKRRAAAGSAALLAGGLMRPHMMLITATALALGNFGGLRGPTGSRRAAALCAILLTTAAFPWASRAILQRLHSAESPSESAFLKDTRPPEAVTAYSPAWITHVRRQRQNDDRRAAAFNAGRAIRTQIFPDAEFRTWADVARFVPKGAFYAAFMPLPGLYPIEGNLGRALCSLENLALLALFAAAVAGFLKGPPHPLPLCLAGFFLACLGVFSLFEFDLGSASRHKLLYFPMIFPFAARALRRPRQP